MRAWQVAAAIGAAAVMGVALGGCGTPPRKAWCAYIYDHGTIDCAYDTFEQCQATVWGAGGYCSQNPGRVEGPRSRRVR